MSSTTAASAQANASRRGHALGRSLLIAGAWLVFALFLLLPLYMVLSEALKLGLGTFFAAILDDLGLRPDQVGFIDDSEPNVSAARALGIATYHHPRGADASTLRAGVESLLASP